MSERNGENRRYGSNLREIYTVSRLNEAARALLEQALGEVWVEGEVSNLARPASGHVYFSLKDGSAQIRCALFRRRGGAPVAALDNGSLIVAQGRVSLYTARGDYQLIVERVEPAGEGLLRQRFEALKRRLHAAGLFEPARKRSLPGWPRAIGVVTSPSGAALHDILTVLARRCPALPVIVYPSAVQGSGAAAEIARAVASANRRAECDVLIVGRGGGSLEDLWPFNEEVVARALFESRIPVVSAVGHEIDFTIADLVADVRAATPSAAAELVSPDQAALRQRLAVSGRRLAHTGARLLAERRRHLAQAGARLRQVAPRRRLDQHYQRLDDLNGRLPQAMSTALRLERGRLAALAARLAAAAPARRLEQRRSVLMLLEHRLKGAIALALDARRQALARSAALVRVVGPQATLERGYAIVTTDTGALVRSVARLAPGVTLTTRLADGRFDSAVTQVHGSSDSERGE